MDALTLLLLLLGLDPPTEDPDDSGSTTDPSRGGTPIGG